MRCINEREVTDWLGERSIPEDPYGCENTISHYLQFYAPKKHLVVAAFTRHFLADIVLSSNVLIHITDWSLYKPSEMLTIDAVRSVHDEHRALVEASGHVLSPTEHELIVAVFGHSVSYEWKSYLYSSTGNTILYNWEGEIFDFWTDDADTLLKMKSLIESFGLKPT